MSGKRKKKVWERYMDERVPRAYAERLRCRDRKGGKAFRLPSFLPDGSVHPTFWRTKHIPPFKGKDGKLVKATQAKGAEPAINFLPPAEGASWTWEKVFKEKLPFYWAESECKAAAIAALGFPALTTGSIWTHRKRNADGESKVISDLDKYDLTGHEITIAPDNDVHVNPNVQDGVFDLDAELRKRGNKPKLLLLPEPEFDNDKREFRKLGMDDYMHQNGYAREAFDRLKVLPLTDARFSGWGKSRRPPVPSALENVLFVPRPLSVYTEKPPKRKYLINPWIGEGLLTFFAMTGGGGKSMLTLDMAIALACHKRFLGLGTKQCKVVLLGMEDPQEEIDRRLYYLANCKYLDGLKGGERRALLKDMQKNIIPISLEGQQLHIITEEDRRIVQTPDLARLIEQLKCVKPGLVIPDPLSQLHTLNESAPEVGSALVAALGRVRVEAETGLLVPAHTNKDADKTGRDHQGSMRGASSLTFGARSVLFGRVLSVKQAQQRFDVDDEFAADRFMQLSHVKQNYGVKGPPIIAIRGEHGIWELPNYNEIKEKKAPDYDKWLSRVEKWLRKEPHHYLSERRIVRNEMEDFGCTRDDNKKYFEQGKKQKVFRLLSKKDLELRPPDARKEQCTLVMVLDGKVVVSGQVAGT